LTYADSLATRAVKDGLLAQKKLDGDTTVMAPDSHEELQRLVSQGKRMESLLRQLKKIDWLKRAYQKAEVPFVE
jgi:hypothetical protein